MILIDDILVDDEIKESKFSCDLIKCKGACCTFPGESGAPVTENEIAIIKAILPKVKKYLPERSLKYIEENGFFNKEKDGSYSASCINDKDCVFVFYEEGIAKCGIERAYNEGEHDFRKPLSCQLFPIRTGNYGGDMLYYEKFDECKPGREKGKREGIPLYKTVKDALIRAYGKDWYQKLEDEIEKD